jgi:hypothetical protein
VGLICKGQSCPVGVEVYAGNLSTVHIVTSHFPPAATARMASAKGGIVLTRATLSCK